MVRGWMWCKSVVTAIVLGSIACPYCHGDPVVVPMLNGSFTLVYKTSFIINNPRELIEKANQEKMENLRQEIAAHPENKDSLQQEIAATEKNIDQASGIHQTNELITISSDGNQLCVECHVLSGNPANENRIIIGGKRNWEYDIGPHFLREQDTNSEHAFMRSTDPLMPAVNLPLVSFVNDMETSNSSTEPATANGAVWGGPNLSVFVKTPGTMQYSTIGGQVQIRQISWVRGPAHATWTFTNHQKLMGVWIAGDVNYDRPAGDGSEEKGNYHLVKAVPYALSSDHFDVQKMLGDNGIVQPRDLPMFAYHPNGSDLETMIKIDEQDFSRDKRSGTPVRNNVPIGAAIILTSIVVYFFVGRRHRNKQ